MALNDQSHFYSIINYTSCQDRIYNTEKLLSFTNNLLGIN
jgi:hypothetical protein